MSIRQQKLPIEALERIDDLCATFEQKWQQDQPASIESILSEQIPPVERNALLAELIVLEVDYRQRRGETTTKQEYLERFPQHKTVVENVFKEQDKPRSAFTPPTVDQLAKLFPGLQILELIGAGGMGAVYKARQEGLDRVVALKILPDEFSHDVKFALRFTREARTLAKLNHPNIVSVYEFGNVDQTYYFLMEYVEGSTLRDVVRARQLKPEHAMTIVPHLCDALQYAHDKGVIHRDIKPENILMTTDGKVKLADFGLSRILGQQNQPTELTGTHQILGTPRYMAPEQLEGSRGVDHRADIYSLGVVFYEMLTGELPIGRFAMPSQKVEVDIRLDEVVLRTLEKEPQLRYQNANQVKSDVESITSTENPAFAQTVITETKSQAYSSESGSSLQQQELAGRFLLTRRQLMERVEQALRPLFRWQIVQILFGVLLIALGAICWAPNTHIPHRLVCGVIVHVYGIVVIGTAAAVCNRIKRIDYSKPVTEVRDGLNAVRSIYLMLGHHIGFSWWLMWIPVCVTLRFDLVLHPNSLYPSVLMGVIGLGLSYYFYAKTFSSNHPSSVKWKQQFAGKSIRNAELALNEITQANIE